MPKAYENKRINPNIKLGTEFNIRGMDDYYLDVTFRYTGRTPWNGCIPIRSRYQGIQIPETQADVYEWAQECYEELNPDRYQAWKRAQDTYWDNNASTETRAVFDAMCGNQETTKWLCRKCGPVQEVNPQSAARIKSLKERGYFIGTKNMYCPTCGRSQTHDILIRLPRRTADVNVRNTISAVLRNRIKTVLPLKDACFDSPQKKGELIIDHKFPSTRWVNGETRNDDSMTDEQIREKFQLLTNQTNLQKERYCKRCLSDGKRGDFFGIKWYYQGNEDWQGTNNADEEGCIGCPWYDLNEWKAKFNEHLNSQNE